MNANPDIKLACMSLMWGNILDDNKWLDWLDDVQAAGYEGVALFDNHLVALLETTDFESQLANRSLSLVSVDYRVDRDAERLRHVCSIMQRLGARHLVALGGLANNTADIDEVAGILNEMGQVALDYEVRAGFHNHTGDIGETLEQMEALMSATDPTKFFGFLDVGHATKDFVGHPVGQRAGIYLDRHWERIDFLEFKDWSEEHDLRTEVGAGLCDYEAVFNILQEREYSGWITVEQNGPMGDKSPRQCAAASLEFIEQGFAKDLHPKKS